MKDEPHFGSKALARIQMRELEDRIERCLVNATTIRLPALQDRIIENAAHWERQLNALKAEWRC